MNKNRYSVLLFTLLLSSTCFGTVDKRHTVVIDDDLMAHEYEEEYSPVFPNPEQDALDIEMIQNWASLAGHLALLLIAPPQQPETLALLAGAVAQDFANILINAQKNKMEDVEMCAQQLTKLVMDECTRCRKMHASE
jgi:hypothetical protein